MIGPATPRMVLSGSERPKLANTQDLGRANATETAQVTVLLRGKMTDAELEELISAEAAKPISERHYFTREELEERRGASAPDIAAIESFAKSYHLEVIATDRAARSITIRGTLANLEAAFGVELHNYMADGAVFRDHAGSISIPANIAPIVRGVLGLSTKPAARH